MAFQKHGGVQRLKRTALRLIRIGQSLLQFVGMVHGQLCCGKSQVQPDC
jgi:hypothetical protein